MRNTIRSLCSAFVVALAWTAAAGAAEPPCLTYIAPDDNEPPCNPALVDSPWGSSHRGNFAQASSPLAGPVPGQPVTNQYTEIVAVPVILDFSSQYSDGGRVAWMSTVSTPDNGTIVKLDVATGAEIDRYTVGTDELRPPTVGGTVSGAYNLVDRDNHLIVGRAQALEIYGDATPGDRSSPIALLKRFQLPASALCRSTDRLVGINMRPDGLVAFATEQGVVGVVPRDPAKMDAAHVVTLSTNGARCADGAVPDADLETVSNSIAVDERGDIYTVTDAAQYRHRLVGDHLAEVWRARYETGAGSGVRIGDGSGSTPTLMGTDARDDRFVVITDGQKLMHLVLMWRDAIPADWKAIAPGKDRRIACEVPVKFGDPNATESVDEQSVLVRGYASVLVNNQLSNSEFLDQLPAQQRSIAAALAGGDPSRAPHGLERIDWDPKTRTCVSRWANRDVSIPNGIPTMSTATGLVYGIGQRGGTWGLEGVDFDTGAGQLWAPTSPLPSQNSFYAATTIGPEGAIWTGTFGGVSIYRGPVAPAPGKACKDIDLPTATLAGVARKAGNLVVGGRASDEACGARVARRPVVRVAVAVRSGRGCRFLDRRGRPGKRVACARARWLRARTGRGGTWRLTLPRPPAGRYLVRALAVDAAGNESAQSRRSRRLK